MKSFLSYLRRVDRTNKTLSSQKNGKSIDRFSLGWLAVSQEPKPWIANHSNPPGLRTNFSMRKGWKWISHFLLLGTVVATNTLTEVANAVPVTHLATQTATATGAGATGTPNIASFNIPSGKNRVLFIWATFERDHCSDADVTAGLCKNANTAGTGLGDNYPEPRVGTAPATTSNNQLTARVVGPGGTINKQNALVIGGTPSGDTRFINISASPQGSPAGTAYISVSSFHIVLFENEINTLLGGAASGTVSITLPDTSVPSNAGDDALLSASVFQNVEQTVNGFVRNATATAQVTTGTPGNSTLAPAAYDAGQAPNEADDGKLVMGANSSTEGFLLPAGHVALATLSVTNAGGNFDTPNGNATNEPNGLTGGAYFRNGGATPGSLYSLQMGGAASTLLYGATNASFLLESDSSDAGDAPLSYGNPTHTIVNNIRLGATVDADAGFLNSSNATGDDTNVTDDEDGVTIPTLTQGQSATISVNVNQVTAGTGRLQGWIDWNGDGDFADAGEQIATNLQLAAGTTGTISVPVTVPAGAITSAATFARFRWSTTASLTSTATTTDGEVEDYQVSIAAAAPSLSGNIFDDLDGSKIKAASGENYTAANITAVLLDASNKVVSTAAVNATGDYTLNNVPAGTYSVKIIQTPGTALTTGVVIPPANDILPTNWVATGENNNGTPDATVDRTQSVTVASANIVNINFGIEQLPNTTALTPASQTNPGGTATVQVPTLAGTDPEDGILGSGKTFKIVTLPTNADLYYNGTKITTPNFVITNYDPTKLTVDPDNGAITVNFTYAAVDAAGQQDSTPATVTMPFTSSSSPANLLLVKRITAINGTPLNVYKDDTDNTALRAADDNNINWPTPFNTNATLGDTNISTFLRGAIDGGKVKPGDTIEYTIYFLNAGGSNANNVRVCDRITGEQKFLSGSTIQLQQNSAIPTALTSIADADRATFYSSSSNPAITNCNFTGTPTIDNGAIMVDVTGATGSPTWTTLLGSTGPGTANTYGMVRFTTKVNP
jgi:uncharacterized repeat protein (TIGR01451 family)